MTIVRPTSIDIRSTLLPTPVFFSIDLYSQDIIPSIRVSCRSLFTAGTQHNNSWCLHST